MNKEEMRVYSGQHYLNNKEKRLKQCKQWVKNNPEKVRKNQEQWRKDNPEKWREYGREGYRKRKKRIRLYVDDYKLSRGCSVCGYNKCAAALDFHHEGDDKEFDIGTGMHCSFKKLQEEMKKCMVLCRNCHSELHDKERKKE